ncbi:right-handed parallel beta-helix repeat-containing protein [Marinobacterium lutimaris]|uniref:Poly(Beta-D-mannuronate) C5 epimerase n=1 Tax=Marinobacterium lutimaris TaxID=568106 RepID=A0A1H6CVI5_9GAMM|nr:right-handed parallel beta-helix repeat-containing protein [Marinobacterium lutimaris]SEG77099.1 poly(beta-D-mannuronate) C5 epimerase [Marinobacterium lutimaris]
MTLYRARLSLGMTFLILSLVGGWGHAATADELSRLDAAEQAQGLSDLREEIDRATELPELAAALPAGRANVSIQTLFSSQQGSWPFEPFVHNGLFRAIAGYQNQHPKTVVVSGGSIDIEQLYRRINNKRVLSRRDDGYLLSYPLIIAPGAALNIADTSLFLYEFSGTAIINRGALNIERARVESFNDDRPQVTERPFRPFIMSWAGSRLNIDSSTLVRLGYNENLSRGITTARSSSQGRDVAPAQVRVRNSQLENLSSGLELGDALADISGNRFSAMQQYAIDLYATRAQVVDNDINGVRNVSGIRLSGAGSALVSGNRVLNATKSALEVEGYSGVMKVSANTLGGSEGYGILLRNSTPDSLQLIEGNLIAGTRSTALDGSGVERLVIHGNRFINTPEYAISIRNTREAEGPVSITDNLIGGVGKAPVRIQGVHRMVLGGNEFRANPLQQNLLVGDLVPYQSSLLQMMLRSDEVAGLELDTVSLLADTEG